MIKPNILVILIVSACLNLCSQDHYTIEVSIKGGANLEVILGHYLGSSIVPVDTIVLNNDGEGAFTGKEALPQGLYFLYLGENKMIDMIIADDQDFKISFSKNIPDFKIEGSKENELFFDYRNYMLSKGAEMGRLNDIQIRSNSKAAKDSIDKVMQDLNTEVVNHVTKMTDENMGTFFSTFVIGARDIPMPLAPKDKDGNLTDSLFYYHYAVEHYFDNFDLSDERLLRTPIYNEKVEMYISQVVAPRTDSLLKAVDFLLSKTENSEELFKNMLSMLMLYSLRNDYSEMDEVFVHLAEDYYLPKADWAEPDFMNLLRKKTNEKKRTLRGQIAPDFEVLEVSTDHFLKSANNADLKTDTLVGSPMMISSVNAEYTILYFWEADCGHCKEVTPKLYEMYEKSLKEKGVKIISIQMLTSPVGKTKWIDFVNKHQLYDWYNVWQPNDFEYRTVYDLRYSPVMYLLDKDHKIIAKNIAPEQVDELIELYKTNKL
ncbi:MAG: DUF5106 domain-containing protein [Bacteroidales bacterium]|nr:DUF5106 domain-containing protein [Bacteroidales bacterium]